MNEPRRGRWMTAAAVVIATALVAGCGPKVEDLVEKAQAALDAGDHESALSLGDQGLSLAAQKGSDARVVLRLKKIRIQAFARSKRGGEASTALEAAAEAHPGQVPSSLYFSAAVEANESGDAPGAVEILDAGLKRFPDERVSFDEKIALLKEQAGGDEDLTNKLESLGYL